MTDMELTPAEIDELRGKIIAESIAARVSGKPVVNVIIVDGPLDGLSLTLLDEPSNQRFVRWSVVRPAGSVTLMHARESNTLRFTGIELSQSVGRAGGDR